MTVNSTHACTLFCHFSVPDLSREFECGGRLPTREVQKPIYQIVRSKVWLRSAASAMAEEGVRQRGAESADAVPSIEILPKLLSKKVLKKGSGPCPPADGTHTAIVHYTGRLEDGTIFDSSVARGSPFRFVLGARQVILAWDKGVATMQKGEKCELRCAPDVAYGSSGAGKYTPRRVSRRRQPAAKAVDQHIC